MQQLHNVPITSTYINVSHQQFARDSSIHPPLPVGERDGCQFTRTMLKTLPPTAESDNNNQMAEKKEQTPFSITLPNPSYQEPAEMGTGKERSWSEVWYDFSQSTTLHGVSNIGERHQHLIRRLLWILIVLGGVGLFVFLLINNVCYYSTWPVTVNVKINYNKTLRFPAVTLCNQNDFRASALAATGRYHLVRDFYSNLYSGGIDLEADGAQNLSLEEIYNSSAHSMDDMIISCIWDEIDCGVDDFETTVTDFGFCYTFNSGRNGRSIKEVSNTGADRGLRLRLNIEQYEYMRGPNSGAGVKILLHNPEETPLVRELGQAIPPGSYAFVGVQIVQVNNLPPPHGECDDSTQLHFFDHYSTSACAVDCKEKATATSCGCRDVYMPADKDGYPPVCTLEKYQSCFIPAIEEFSRHRHKCNCTIPCRRTLFDPTISYAVTTNYETDSLLRSERVDALQERYTHARETIQRAEETLVADNTMMVTRLNLTVNRISKMLHGITHIVQDIRQTLQDELTLFYQKTWFHWKWGLEKLEFVGRHDFTRGWEIMAERSFSLLTTNYQQDVAYIKDIIRRITDPTSGLSSVTREALAVDIKGRFFDKQVIGELSLANLDEVCLSFSTGQPLVAYKATPQNRYDMSYITLKIIGDDPNQLWDYYRKLVLHVNRYLDAMHTMQTILDEAMNNSSVDMDALGKAGDAFEAAARMYNSYRFKFEERVAQKPVSITTGLQEQFTKLNDSLSARLDEVDVFLGELTRSLTGADTSWQHILMLNQLATRYLFDNNLTKTDLAVNFTSSSTVAAIKNIKTFLSTVKTRSRDIESLLTRLERAYELIWENMLTEYALSPFYGNISKDVAVLIAQPANNTERNYLVPILAYMVNKERSYVSENPDKVFHLTNADFVSTSVEDKMSEIHKLFESLKQGTGIDAVMEDEDDFFDAFDYTQQEMETFLATNVIDENFFSKNFMQVDVFMKELSYEEIDQQVAYDMTALWSDIGGSIGLFIGASVITIFEIFDVILRNCWRFYCKNGKNHKPKKVLN